MSFILDALRKSEVDRQRDAAPGLMRTPLANVRRETPFWTWLLIGLLAFALIGIGAAWWFSGQEERAGADEKAALAPAAAAAPAASAASAAMAAGATRDAQAASPSAGTAALATGEPRPIMDLIRSEPGLPRFSLSFVEYNSTDPDASSAWINGRRYYPGQIVDGGPVLARIQIDGAVLAWRGQLYLLTAR